MSIFIILSFSHNKNESFASYVQTGNSSFNTVWKNAIERVPSHLSMRKKMNTHGLFIFSKYNEQTVDEKKKKKMTNL